MNMVPRAVLLNSGIVNTARQKFSNIAVSVNNARQVSTAHPKSTVNVARPMSHLSKTAHSTVKRSIHKKMEFNNSNVNQRVNIVRSKIVNTVRPKVVVNVVHGDVVNAVKASTFNTACYVQNRVLVVKPHNKTPYELFHGRTPALSFMEPFGCPVTILNTLDHLGKFDGKADEGFFVGYSMNSKAFRVFNSRKRIVEENLHIRFSENTPNVVGSRPDWLFDIDTLTRTMNYEPIVAGTQSNSLQKHVIMQVKLERRKNMSKITSCYHYGLLIHHFFQDSKSFQDDEFQPLSDSGKKVDEDPSNGSECRDQKQDDNVNSTNNVNAASTNEVNTVSENISNELPFDLNIHALEDISTFNFLSDHEDDNEEADMHNMDTTIQMDVKSDFLYEKIIEEVYVCQPPGFEDPNIPDKMYKVEKHYMDYIKLLEHEVKNASTPIETKKPMLKDEDGEEVDVDMYRSMIGSLMYLTSSRPNIMFAVCACARYQVNPKVSHLYDMKRIFRYLKGHPKLGLWYLKDSPFDLVAYTDSDYAGASLDRKPTIGDCQFLWCRLISWRSKK
nr:uncharacterized mitochondrial protein AtMg00810-like [Tanacetum cinerariifolium]